MAQSVILVRLTLDWEDVDSAQEYLKGIRGALMEVEGFQGAGVWKGVKDPHARLALLSYESPEAARRGLAAIGELPTLIELQSAGAAPADVTSLVVDHADGAFDHRLPDGAYVSLSVRSAQPGYGPELVEEYEEIFGGLSMIPGYAGMLIGVNAKLADEVVGLVAWDDESSFASSMPSQTIYDVTLFERSVEG